MRRGVAQMEARCVWDAEVGGSSPPTPTILFCGNILFKSQLITILLIIYLLVAGCNSMKGDIFPTEPTHTQTIVPPSASASPSFWIPSANSVFQIQLSDYPPNIHLESDIFELDLFETPSSAIRFLHQRGKKVICYLNAGAWEDFRPDATDFPQEAIGNPYVGWPGERWLDVRNFNTFAPVMSARLDLAVEKGCDAIDPDNINGYLHPTGFNITYQDQLAYNKWLSEQAHQRGMSIGMKNNGDQANDLIEDFDFVVTEDCFFFDECDLYSIFSDNGKAVFQIEYTDRISDLGRICDTFQELKYQVVLKNRNLDAYVEYCPKNLLHSS